MRKFQVTIDVTIVDEERVLDQARAIIEESGCPEAADELTLRDAVGWLFDSGSSKFDYALEIDSSTTQEFDGNKL